MLAKNQWRIYVSVPVTSLQRLNGFEILWELKTDKPRYSYKTLVDPILVKKGQICWGENFSRLKTYAHVQEGELAKIMKSEPTYFMDIRQVANL